MLTMSRGDYNIEDFVLDPEFRSWVLQPTNEIRLVWEKYLNEHPHKSEEVYKAKLILLNLSRRSHEISQEKENLLWKKIASDLSQVEIAEKESPVIPIHSSRNLKFTDRDIIRGLKERSGLGLRTVSFLFGLVLTAVITVFIVSRKEENTDLIVENEWVDHVVPKGQKAIFTLTDGTRVTVNSGSVLRHVKNFESDKREVFLKGEAYFEVAKDEEKPFSVHADGLVTTAVGTAFNIKSSKDKGIKVSLLEGKVKVSDDRNEVFLQPGESVNYSFASSEMDVIDFDEDEVMAWTRKIIFLKDTEIKDVFEILENWYGVEIMVSNPAQNDIRVTGKYQDQMLKNVLSGLSYTAGFYYEIDGKKVTINFK